MNSKYNSLTLNVSKFNLRYRLSLCCTLLKTASDSILPSVGEMLHQCMHAFNGLNVMYQRGQWCNPGNSPCFNVIISQSTAVLVI